MSAIAVLAVGWLLDSRSWIENFEGSEEERGAERVMCWSAELGK